MAPTSLTSGSRTIAGAGLVAGCLDICAAFIDASLQGRTPKWVLQVIASGLLGRDSYERGFSSAALGLVIHFVIATTAAAMFYVASRKLRFMTGRAVISGLLYGVAVYLFMYFVVLELRFPNRPALTVSSVVKGLIIHMLCVGLPISLVVRRYSNVDDDRRAQQRGERHAAHSTAG
jgi:hypothetical protein